MEYQVLALKYRPGNFDEVVGQSQVTEVLKGALTQDRIAKAYIFSGPRGCGKTTSARILAKALNCAKGPTPLPCGSCESCLSIAKGSSLAVIEIDAASTGGVQDIRDMREEAALASIGGRYKIYILDEAHQISVAGNNALLKTLEEPPPNTVFILATTEPQKMLPTVHSRCQHFQFRLLSVDDIAARLGAILAWEGIDYDPEVVQAVARRADGSMRDGLTILDQVLASSEGKLVLERVTDILGLTSFEHFFALTEALQARDGAAAIRELSSILDGGLETRAFALGLARYFRNLLLCKLDPTLLESEMIEEDRVRCGRLAEPFAMEDLLYLSRLVGERADQIRYASQPRILLETLVVELSRFESRVMLSEILARLREMGGGSVSSGGGGASVGGRKSSLRGEGWEGRSDTRRADMRRTDGRQGKTQRGDGRRSDARQGAQGADASPRASAFSERGRPSPTEKPASGAEASRVSGGVHPVAFGAASPASAPLDFDGDPRSIWDDYIRLIGSEKKSLASFLERARPGRLSEKSLVLLLENNFALAMLDTPEHLLLLSDRFATLSGRRVEVILEMRSDGGESEEPERISREHVDKTRRRQDLKEHAGDELVKDLLQRFDGEILED